MTDTSNQQPGGGDGAAGGTGGDVNFGSLSSFVNIARRGDIMLAAGVIAILSVLILPMPPMLLDFSLALSILLSVLILMTVLFI